MFVTIVIFGRYYILFITLKKREKIAFFLFDMCGKINHKKRYDKAITMERLVNI
jgi:hypothetical protein